MGGMSGLVCIVDGESIGPDYSTVPAKKRAEGQKQDQKPKEPVQESLKNSIPGLLDRSSGVTRREDRDRGRSMERK
jgi:hypothetical protein